MKKIVILLTLQDKAIKNGMQATALLGIILLPKELTIISEQGHSKVDTLEIVEIV